MKDEKRKIISDICPFYKEYGTCEQCNTELDIDGEPCYFECMANAIINNGYSKQSEGEWISNKLGGYKYAFYCSECGWVDGYPFNDRHKFCPNCGAKMKGGVTAESAIKAVQEAAHKLKDTPPDDLLGIGSTMQF
jgi:PHP family Zn ribbon phosphoesterase